MKNWVLILLISMTAKLQAQELLSIKDAFSIALQNNLSIQLAKNDLEAAKIGNSLGQAGALPSITGNAGFDNQIVDIQQKFLNGATNERNGASNNVVNASIDAGWDIFSGLRVYATKARLVELEKMGELQLRQRIEQLYVQVNRVYYDVVLAKLQLKFANQAFELSKSRFELVNNLYQSGKAAKVELLRAQVDMNADKSLMMRSEASLQNAKMELNTVLVRDLKAAVEVPDTIEQPQDYNLDQLMGGMLQANAQLQMLKRNQHVSMLAQREIKSERLPVVQLRGGYQISRLESEAGFLVSNQLQGVYYGGTLRMNIFNGMDVNRRSQIAGLQIKSAEMIYRDSLLRMQSGIQQAFANYTMALRLVAFEQENLSLARESMEISTSQYKAGVITSLELRDAQQNLLSSELRLLQAQYEAKLLNVELMRLSGGIANEY
jgi:outer membrane protein TolC